MYIYRQIRPWASLARSEACQTINFRMAMGIVGFQTMGNSLNLVISYWRSLSDFAENTAGGRISLRSTGILARAGGRASSLIK